MNKQQLIDNIRRKQSFLCVGLDTDIKKIPDHLLEPRPTSAWPTSPTWPSTNAWA